MSTRDTSLAAANSMVDMAAVLRTRVLAEIQQRGDRGATCDEIEVVLELRHQTASARIRELAIAVQVLDSGRKRLTRSQRRAVVWTYVPPDQVPLEPPLKWVGGKRWLVPYLRELYAPFRDRRLVEPFVGGMSVALGLRPTRALLSDVNPHLINFYSRLRKDRPFTVAMANHEGLYYAQRDHFNALIELPNGKWTDDAAELFYYLNKNCFNGLCRFNNSGLFNTPFGRYATVNYRRDFSEYAAQLQAWTIECADFETLVFESDDWIFCDPPYDDTFTDYSAGGFSWADQERLVCKLASHPGPVVISNKATERIIDLYRNSGYQVQLLDAPRRISAQGDRTPAKEVLATRNFVVKLIDSAIATGVTVSSASRVNTPNPEDSDSDNPEDENNPENGDAQMANLPPEMAEQVGKARTAGGGSYIQHGDYVMMVKKWFYQKIQDRCIILELVPVESRKKIVYEGQKAVEQDPNAPGSECSDTANFDGEGKLSAPGNSRAPVLALFGFKEGEVSDQIVSNTLDEMVGPANPGAGMLITCSTFPKEIRSKKGSYITGRNYDHVAKPGQGVNSPEAVKARLDAFRISPEKLIEVVTKQLADARAAGAAPHLVSTPSQPTGGPAAPPPPGPPPPPPAQAAVDPIQAAKAAGWVDHPTAPGYMMRGEGDKYEAKLKTAFV